MGAMATSESKRKFNNEAIKIDNLIHMTLYVFLNEEARNY